MTNYILKNKSIFIGCLLVGIIVILTRMPAISNSLQSYPGDTVKWAAPAVNFATYGFSEVVLPRIDQGDYAELTGHYYYRWPLLSYYTYGAWASIVSDSTISLRLLSLVFHLVGTLYFFLICTKVFKDKSLSFLALILYIAIPGHFYMSVQIADTQLWLTAFLGATYHRVRWKEHSTNSYKHSAAYYCWLIYGCMTSWFGFLVLFAYMLINALSSLIDNNHSTRIRLKGIFTSRSNYFLLSIMLAVMVFHFTMIYFFIGNQGIDNMTSRFSFWVANTSSTQPLDTPIAVSLLTEMLAALTRTYHVHIPRIFGSYFLWAMLVTAILSIPIYKQRVKKIVDLRAAAQFIYPYTIVFILYLIIFARHANRDAHSFTFQLATPVFCFILILCTSIVIGKYIKGRKLYILIFTLCIPLTFPKYLEYHQSSDLNTSKNRKEQIGYSKEFGSYAKIYTKKSDYVLTNKVSHGYFDTIGKYIARRTISFKVSSKMLSEFINNEEITGLVYIHYPPSKLAIKDEKTLNILKHYELANTIDNRINVYRIK